MGVSLPSKTLLALWAALVAMGTMISAPLAFSFCRIVASAEVSPLAFWALTWMSERPAASSSEIMVSRI